MSAVRTESGRCVGGFIHHISMTKSERMRVRYAIKKRDGDRCARCGWGGDGNLTLDHIVPRILGGNNSLHNLQLLCFECNILKGERIVDYRPGHYA